MENKPVQKRGNFLVKIIMPAFLICLVQIFASGAGAFFVFSYLAATYQSGSYLDFMEKYQNIILSPGFSVWVSIGYAAFLCIFFGVWFLRQEKEKRGDHRGRRKLTERPVVFAFGLVLFAFGMQYLCTYLMNVLAALMPSWLEQYETLAKGIGLDEKTTLPLFLYAVILGPLCEELACRGLTFGAAREVMPFWPANLIQALVFAGLHGNPLQASYAFLLALFLGYFMEKSGRLLLPVLVHVAFNVIAVVGKVLIVGGDSPVAFFLLLFGSMVACYVGFECIARNIPKIPEQNN